MDISVMTDNLLKLKAFKLKGRLYTLTVLQVLDTSPAAFDEQMSELIKKAPRLFEKSTKYYGRSC